MNSGLNPADPTLVAAFRSALLHQGAIALAIVVFLLLLAATARIWRGDRPATATTRQATTRQDSAAEPRARAVLRIGFGLLWVFDGFLQAQPKMAGGLAAQVIEPGATSSPSWVQHVVNWGGTIWSYHPIEAAAASVWIQLGLGAWLLVAMRGPWSRLAGASAAAWGLIVWVFGESFGQIFAPGQTFLFGAPGAVLFYVAAGVLIALPEAAWRGPALGRLLLRGSGLLFIGMAVLQAWPGRGFWQGGKDGTLTGMISDMADTAQPRYLHLIVSGASSFTSAHGWAVNAFAVTAMAIIGLGLVSTGQTPWQRWAVRHAVWLGGCFCLADWLLVQDLGFLGGLGTDPNSMIPVILLFTAGYAGLRYAGLRAEVTAPSPEPTGARSLTSVSARSLAAVCAVVVIGIGAAPMAAAAANRTADPILAQAIDGDTTPLAVPAPGFRLIDQHGTPVSLASLRGKVVLMTFLDPVCTTDCPIIGAEFRQAAAMLGADRARVELIAVAANPTYYSIPALRAFDAEEKLAAVPNWHYLTGPLTELRQLWRFYGIGVRNAPAGAMAMHTDLAVVIDAHGTIREEIDADPGPGTAGTQSSFAVLLAGYARQALR